MKRIFVVSSSFGDMSAERSEPEEPRDEDQKGRSDSASRRLKTLSTANSVAQRSKVFTVLAKNSVLFFVTELERAGTGPAYNIACARLEPSQRYLDDTAAVSANDLHWNIRQAGL